MAIVPKDGYAWNPLRKFPVNEACFCGSGRKAKKCCLPMQPLIVESRLVDDIKLMMKSKLRSNQAEEKVSPREDK